MQPALLDGNFRGGTALPDVSWPTIIASLAGGGAMGAVLGAAATAIRARIQPVGYRAESSPLLRPISDGSNVRTKVTILHADQEFKFENLHLVEVQITNRGNLDRPSFPFGLTLPPGEHAVAVEPVTKDRHHVVKQAVAVCPIEPQATLDFALEPFNRGYPRKSAGPGSSSALAWYNR